MSFTAKRYRCICRDGFKGENCDEGMTRQVDSVFFFEDGRVLGHGAFPYGAGASLNSTLS